MRIRARSSEKPFTRRRRSRFPWRSPDTLLHPAVSAAGNSRSVRSVFRRNSLKAAESMRSRELTCGFLKGRCLRIRAISADCSFLAEASDSPARRRFVRAPHCAAVPDLYHWACRSLSMRSRPQKTTRPCRVLWQTITGNSPLKPRTSRYHARWARMPWSPDLAWADPMPCPN